MIDISVIRKNPDLVQQSANRKGFEVNIPSLLAVDLQRRNLLAQVEEQRAERNRLSEQIRDLRGGSRELKIEASRNIAKSLSELESNLAQVSERLHEGLLRVPGLLLSEVPEGTREEDNVEIRRWGMPRRLNSDFRDHVQLAALHRMVDFEGPRSYAGSRSYALLGNGVLLEQAIIQMSIDILTQKGLTPVQPPILVKHNALLGTGFFPHGLEETYYVTHDDLYLCGTSEVGIVSLHRESIVPYDALPIRYVGLSPCFRREAGSAGRDTKGLYRVHQFTKVEQVSIVANDESVSEREHRFLLANSEEILRALELPYRVCLACSAEVGFPQAKKHEVEAWFPSRNAYGETHSCSTLHDFQARRSNIRYRQPEGGLTFVHTLNNTGVASPRILAALLENHQDPDGSINIPLRLRPYLHNRDKLMPPAAGGGEAESLSSLRESEPIR